MATEEDPTVRTDYYPPTFRCKRGHERESSALTLMRPDGEQLHVCFECSWDFFRAHGLETFLVGRVAR